MADTVEVLAGVPLFSMLSKKDLASLASEVHDRTFPAGKNLADEEELGATFIAIADGEATVNVHGNVVRHLGPGDYFGEMALIDREARSATVTAKTDLRCLILTAWAFRPLALKHPEVAWALLEMMVKRVREAEARSG